MARSDDRPRDVAPFQEERPQIPGRFSSAPTPTRIRFGDRGKRSATINTLGHPSCQRIDFAFRLLTIPIAPAIPAVQSNKVYPPMTPSLPIHRLAVGG